MAAKASRWHIRGGVGQDKPMNFDALSEFNPYQNAHLKKTGFALREKDGISSPSQSLVSVMPHVCRMDHWFFQFVLHECATATCLPVRLVTQVSRMIQQDFWSLTFCLVKHYANTMQVITENTPGIFLRQYRSMFRYACGFYMCWAIRP
ncbi:uncharacterized protein MCYG_08578 [Microsporum canis CBS 113480]|uniref:Uncharacterized protein n=1 Tax=Arthroderma otae (strain ATCC MYA-4605 / CBS 113480) TaxID=554155 RepID=C5G0V6_ARTOC|nr:uncharacterized protein MCYG_08578 [Microsporum canis CBS 113480]EEQ35759.1 predicted protein [Microsporum canis CBS 113480]